MRIFGRVVMATIAVALVAIALNMWTEVPVARAAGPVEVDIVAVSGFGSLPVSIDGGSVWIDGGTVQVDGRVRIQEPIEVQGSVHCYQ